MHGKCLNYKVLYKSRVVLIFIWVYLQYNWKVQEKPGQGSALMLHQTLPGSHCACLAREVPLYLAELLLCFTSGAECWCGPAVQQLALIYPRWWYLRNQLSNVSTMYCLGFAKSHCDPEKLSHLTGLPQIGWKKQALCVGEVGSRNEGGGGEKSWEGGGIVHL